MMLSAPSSSLSFSSTVSHGGCLKQSSFLSISEEATKFAVSPAHLKKDRKNDRKVVRLLCRAEEVDREENGDTKSCHTAGRRQLAAITGGAIGGALFHPLLSFAETSNQNVPDLTITDKVFLTFDLCPTATRLDRTLGDTSLVCEAGEPMGKVVIGLYGNQVPRTVENFKAMVSGEAGSSYKGTTIHKILQGQYIQAGRQGSVDKGEVDPPDYLERNTETVKSSSFLLSHNRPGTVSLCLGANDDDEERKLFGEYRNVEFLITTGPGPAPQLDNGNIVFGTVLEGMDIISAIASIPSYKPSEKIRQFNDFAEFLGDDRASKGRSFWNRPLKAVVIRDCGVL